MYISVLCVFVCVCVPACACAYMWDGFWKVKTVSFTNRLGEFLERIMDEEENKVLCLNYCYQRTESQCVVRTAPPTDPHLCRDQEESGQPDREVEEGGVSGCGFRETAGLPCDGCGGVPCSWPVKGIHGDKSQSQRDWILRGERISST